MTTMAMVLVAGEWHHIAVAAGRWFVDGEPVEGLAHAATWTGVDLTDEEVRTVARAAMEAPVCENCTHAAHRGDCQHLSDGWVCHCAYTPEARDE